MQIITDRRALHQIPELEMYLPKTMEYLYNALSGLKCRVFSPMESALCAFFDFGRDSAIAFRADCDALQVTEKNDVPYRSCHPGLMHACGHDGHMAILLELARRLNEKTDLSNNVLLLFQPGEESPGGALPLSQTGVLETYGVKAVFGLHLWPELPAGRMFSRANELMSRSSEVNVDVFGRSAHIGKAKEGLDSLAAAVQLYTRAMEMEQRLPTDVFRLLKFGRMESGTVRNALSAHTHMEGSLRAFQDEVFESLRDGLTAIGRDVQQETGCNVQVQFAEGYRAVINPPELYHKVAELMDLGELEAPSMTSEDFSFYQRRVPGLFMFLGVGNTPALHSDTFDFDEEILLKGADFFVELAEKFQ